MHYDLTDLKVFLAVAEEGNLSRGAARCHLAPSSVSLRIKDLEEAVGAALLVREPRGVKPTPAGRVVMEHAQRCIAQLEQMHADLQPFSQGLAGHVTFFANNNAIGTYLPDDLARFFALYPSVRITLEERASDEIVAAVAAGRADLGMVALESDYSHPDLDFLPYKEDQMVLLAPLGSPFADQASVGFAACLSAPFIGQQQGSALHTFLMNRAAALGGRLDVRVQVSGYRAIVRLVSSGAGIGIVPRSALEEGDETQLAIVDLAEHWARRDLHVCVRRQPGEKNHFREKLVELLCPGRAPSNPDLNLSR
ncbi:LysR family transcriptional regulator [Oxalobacteraceae bacterium CAVE-383]|nr:LysR family transcriptional regulator [Oxalobacteraceae bacterium CAVE-383]